MYEDRILVDGGLQMDIKKIIIPVIGIIELSMTFPP